MKRWIAAVFFCSIAFASVILAWATRMPYELIIPSALAWGYWVLPWAGQRLMSWSAH